MKKHVLVFSALTLATSAAFAWTPGSQQCVDWLRQHGSNHPDCAGTTLPPATPAAPPVLTAEQQQAQAAIAAILARLSQEQTATGGNASATGGLSQNDLRVVSDNWNLLAPAMQNEFRATISGMNSSSRVQLENAINNASSATASANGAAGNTTVIGGTTYAVSYPVAGAKVELAPVIQQVGSISITISTCGGDFDIEEHYGIVANSHALVGLVSVTRSNGAVYKKVPKAGSRLEYGEWYVTGETIVGGQIKLVQEQLITGFQSETHAYIVGSNASSGLNFNGQNGAAATGNGAGVQTYGNYIIKHACSMTRTRTLTPVPSAPPTALIVVPPPPPAPPAAAEPSLDLKKEPRVTGRVIFTGPHTPKDDGKCPVTQPDGSVKRVPKRTPQDICGSKLETAPTVVDGKGKGMKVDGK